MKRRYLWFAISGAIVVIAVGALAVKGLNLGIDFKGGTQVTFTTPKPVSLANVRTEAASVGSEPIVQGRGKAVGGDQYKSFQLRLRTLTGPQTTQLSNDIKQRFGQDIALQIQTVSASFGKQIARSAIIAILFSLLLIILYVAIRFDFKFAGPVIVALLHDIVITVGVYALIGREVSNSTVAAVLTVLGYSIYDTIIIFDRIRENIPLMRRAPFATIANVSLWETIRRSLATTFITLLPIGALLVFGGATLQDFAFALMVGIVSGGVLVDLHRRAVADDLEGARARVRAPQGPGAGARPGRGWPSGRRRPILPRGGPAVTDGGTLALEQAEQAAAAQPAPSLGDALPQPPVRPRRSGNAGGSAERPSLMAERAELREIAEKLVLAGVGAVALTAERADTLAEELSARGGIGREEARSSSRRPSVAGAARRSASASGPVPASPGSFESSGS